MALYVYSTPGVVVSFVFPSPKLHTYFNSSFSGSLAVTFAFTVNGSTPVVLSTLIEAIFGALLPPLKSIRYKPASSFLVNQPEPYSRKYNFPSGPISISIGELTLILERNGSILSKSPSGESVTAFSQPRIH